MLEQYPGKVRLAHKFLPLHDFSRKAALAALAAGEQGKFWEFNDKLYELQIVLGDQMVMEIARQLHLDLTKFREAMDSPELGRLIDRDLADARRLGVPGTPWVYINGRVLKDRTLPGFRRAIDGELGARK